MTVVHKPSKKQFGTAVFDLAASAALELAVAKLGRRLKRSRGNARPGLVRRTLAAVVTELVAEGATEMYWQRRHLRARVDKRLAADRMAIHEVRVPAQRQPARAVGTGSGTGALRP